MEIWKRIEQFQAGCVRRVGLDGDNKFLNGPKLDGDDGHSSQDDIDAMFH